MMNLFMILGAGLSTLAAASGATAINSDELGRSARETLTKFVEADTTSPPGNEKRIVELVARRLDDAGIPYEITEFAPNRQNIVARLKGTGPEMPVLLLAHLDVVGAAGQEWATDPHKVVEKDGYLYGRGVMDDLGMAVVNLETFIALKRSGVNLRRDVILALTGDEESGGAGIRYLISHRKESIAAGVALNELGGPSLSEGDKVTRVDVQTSEKIYQDFELVTKGPTGHSSIPLEGNAIYRLARALDRLGKFKFPAHMVPVMRAYFQERAPLESPRVSKAMLAAAKARHEIPPAALKVLEENPLLSAIVRTTCVATMVSGGTRVNALPAEARAKVNCRILPDQSAEQVAKVLETVINDREVKVAPIADFGIGGESPIRSSDLEVIKGAIHKQWPGVPIIPFLSRGATDSRFLRPLGVAAYGLSPLSLHEADSQRAHGVDERIPAGSLKSGIEFLHRLLLDLAGT